MDTDTVADLLQECQADVRDLQETVRGLRSELKERQSMINDLEKQVADQRDRLMQYQEQDPAPEEYVSPPRPSIGIQNPVEIDYAALDEPTLVPPRGNDLAEILRPFRERYGINFPTYP